MRAGGALRMTYNRVALELEYLGEDAFQVAAIPAMFLIDEQGRIVAEWRGEIDIDDVQKAVEGLLAGIPAQE